MEAINGYDVMVGNYLYFKNTKDIAVVDLIHGKHFDCREFTTGSFIPNGNYEPIELHPEVLSRLGFKLDDQGCYSMWVGNMNYSYSVTEGFCFGQGMEYSYDIEMKYVHELQIAMLSLAKHRIELKIEKNGS